MEEWVKDCFYEGNEQHLEVGMITRNPRTGKMVKIVRGEFWGKWGLSNYWW